MFELSPFKIIVLGVVALLVFGPERLPAMAAQAGRMLRELRRMAEGAKAELQDSLPSELSEFDVRDLNPRHFVRKHLVDELTGDGVLLGAMSENGNGNGNVSSASRTATTAARPGGTLPAGESPPFDSEAT